MPRKHAQQVAALTCVAVGGLIGAHALAAAPQPQPSSPFGGAAAQHVHAGGIEVNLGGGALQHVQCAPGAQPGTSCYLAR